MLANHTAQLVVPWFLFAPEPLSTIAAVIIVVTQGYLMISGNFSWLNFLTIALGLSVIDGSVLAHVLPVDPPADLGPTPDVADRAHGRAGGVRRGAQHPDRGQPAVARTSG